MTVKQRRFSISLTQELERELRALHQKHFDYTPKSEMLRYLIKKGLRAASKSEREGKASPSAWDWR